MPLHRAALATALALAALAGPSCAVALSVEEALLGDAASSAALSEETGDVTGDAVAGNDLAALTSEAEVSAALPVAPADAVGVCDLDAQRSRILARYDGDGDGRLDASERATLRADLEAAAGSPLAVRLGLGFRAHVVRRLHWIFDTDGDGVLSVEERTAMLDALEARCERVRATLLTRFDTNGNGSLDASERQAARDAFLARVAAARAALLATYDANANGVLDDGERLQLRADRLAAFQARRAALVAQYDTDRSGSLDATELLALKQAIIQRITEGRDAE